MKQVISCSCSLPISIVISPFCGAKIIKKCFGNLLNLAPKWLVMPLVGKSQHLLVTPAVAESLDVVLGSVEAEGEGSLAVLYCLGKGFANAMHFLFSITIIGLEPTGHLAIDNFYLGAQYLDAV